MAFKRVFFAVMVSFYTGALWTAAGADVVIREWDVPTPNSRPHDPAAAPDGSLWYTGQTANKLGRLDPSSGQIREYSLPIPNSGPHGLVADRAGFIWYTANSAGYIGKLNPSTGEVTPYMMPDARATDPHTPVFDQRWILWFTVQGGNFLGKLDTQTGTVTLRQSPTAGSRPYGIIVNSQGIPFFCENGTNKIGRIDPGTFEITEYILPQGARPRRLTAAPDDVIYYSDDRGYLGQLDPKTGQSQQWLSPGGANAAPYGIAATADGIVWYSESGIQPNTLVRFDPRTASFERWTIPSGGGVVRHIVASAAGDLYLACSGVNKVGIAYVSTGSTFAVPESGGVLRTTSGSSSSVVVGSARVQADAGSTVPAGFAVFGFRQGNVLVTEAAVPAAPPMRSGRIYAEVNGSVTTGLAIANPNSEAATVSFYFTDSEGRNFGEGSTTIPPNGQIARFLNEPPFNGGTSIDGTLTLISPLPVSALALRGSTNERSEFLITTAPVTTVSPPGSEPILSPHFADGGGWVTQVVLVNPTDETLAGTAQFFSQGSAAVTGQPMTITVNGQTAASFPYSIAPRSSRRLVTSGSGASTRAGSVRVVPSAAGSSPSGFLIVSFKQGRITVTEAGVPTFPARPVFRLIAEGAGNFSRGEAGSFETGVAVANPSSDPVNVSFELTTLAGGPTGLTGTVTVPAQGQSAMFLHQIPGFDALSFPFQGVLRVSTPSTAGIAVTGLRSRYNERGNYLITTTPPTPETDSASSSELVFPHIVDGGGYTTQFVLFSPSASQSPSGVLRFLTQVGEPLSLQLR